MTTSVRTRQTIRGAGGGSDDDVHVPVESPDSLRSRQYARLIDAVSEGPIGGLVNGLKSVYLNDTPIESPDGTANFTGIVIESRGGTQDQTYLPGFAQVESEIAVAVKVTATNPVVRTLTNINLNAVRVTIRIPALTYQHENGDITGTSVSIAIDLQRNGGGWQQVVADTITGKTTSGYHREYRVALPPGGPWDVRVRRLTADAEKSNTQNDTYWNSYTEIIDAKLRYPMTALFGLQIDSEQFQQIPTRGYEIYGRIISVPTNYDPATRGYDGVWDGTFKPAWTDNPAWIFYDICTNDRFGLGARLDVNQVDKWALYEIARYCDERVPDGFGGEEPRFTCNLFIQQRRQAYEFITSLASIFRGITYWSAGQITAVQDRPGDVVSQFAPANVIDGQFTYSGSSARARHTVALVTWNDPADMYRQAIEAVIDDEGVARYGIVETEVTAMGCTSRGQAHRLGKWILYSERAETETVSFKAGMDAARIYPGAIIQTLDPHRTGQRMGGRLAAATASALTLDAPVTLRAGDNYTISVVLPSGAIQSRGILWGGEADEDVTDIALASALDDVPQQWSIWVIASQNAVPEMWRTLSVTESDTPGQVEITAISHHPDKFAAVEQGIILEPRPVSTLRTIPGPVTDLQAKTVLTSLNAAGMTTRISLGWTPPDGAVSFVIAWRRDEDNWHKDTSAHQAYDIDNVPPGTYLIRVIAVNALGREGPAVEITHAVDNSATAPDVQNLRLEPDFIGRDVSLVWDAMPAAVNYRVRVFDEGSSGGVDAGDGTVLNLLGFDASSISAESTQSGSYLATNDDNPSWMTWEIAASPVQIGSIALKAKLMQDGTSVAELLNGAEVDYTTGDFYGNPTWVFTGIVIDGMLDDEAPRSFGLAQSVGARAIRIRKASGPVGIMGEAYDSGGFIVRAPGTIMASEMLREDWVQIPAYIYGYDKNLTDDGPRRTLKFEVVAYTLLGHSANAATLTASNPPPAAPAGIRVEAGPGQVGVSAIRPTDPDLAGMIVWMSTDPAVPTTDANRVYMGADNANMQFGLQPGVPVYFKLAFYDAFGPTLLNVSNSVSGTPLATGGIKSVTELPASPADVGGDLAVFLDVEDETRRGLWGWDGENWLFTRDGANLVANSVTADQLNVTQLSAISGNLGTMTAGNFTLDAAGFIKGGATSWSAGTGFWQGYDGTVPDGAYKWRVGTPGGAGASWDGTNFTIYGPDGSITLQSGSPISGSGYADWGDLVDKLGPITSANVGTIIPTAAIGAAQIGSLALVGTGNFSVKSGLTGARMEMNGDAIKVYDENNVLRVQMGNLEV
ncbi:MAG: hypothetical protein LBP58_02985 [Azoarcus sp.]|jgi:hypothetical protein|nr:hypothetical protein [Azoarcus sp.]